MDIDAQDIGVGGFILAQFGVIYRMGKNYGILKQQVAGQKERMDKYDERFDKVEAEMARIFQEKFEQIDIKIAEIRGRFITENGEPRYVTYRAYDKLQAHCQHHILTEIGHIREQVAGVTLSQKEMMDKVDAINNCVAVLSARQ